MSDKFLDIYRIPSARAGWWDYGNNAAYFVTICTDGREQYLGEIRDGIMHLSEMGKIANLNWMEIPGHFPFIKLDVFVVMPNHLHGILVIDKPNDPGTDAIYRVSDKNPRDAVEPEVINQLDAINRVSTENQYPGGITGGNNPMLSDNLARTIRWYKGKTTFQCRSFHADFTW